MPQASHLSIPRIRPDPVGRDQASKMIDFFDVIVTTLGCVMKDIVKKDLQQDRDMLKNALTPKPF